jgi:hypothetical protein
MIQPDSSNDIFRLATSLVNDTSQHVFITGRAGTGKTTFLRYVREQTQKNCVIVAPTGVAAINAGGVTMHSFFQLPFGMFIPGSISQHDYSGSSEISDRRSLFRNIHFNSNKRKLLEELELLIIDEVSMMRCDMLDAIDVILRHFRKTPLPFGGVQVVYIGDMFQLPPVVQNEEWNVLSKFYENPFFFSAHVTREAPPLYIELQKIYRQTEKRFINVLNRIRNNQLLPDDFEFLNERFHPDFIGDTSDEYITITTHNKKADAINATMLSKLPGNSFSFKATVKDEFSDKAYPTDQELFLKEGAQVMFIKNDSSNDRRYYNGRIGTVKKIENDSITVAFQDGTELEVERETWKNVRYTYDKEKDKVCEDELGSFTQFPIRLAWAITIHKSQGLTFNHVIIDAGASFAPGQVYVALSRCTSMDGIILKSRIPPHVVSTDRRIVEFSNRQILNTAELEIILENEKYKFWGQKLHRLFEFKNILGMLNEWVENVPEKKIADNEAIILLAKDLIKKVSSLNDVGIKFQVQLHQLLEATQRTKSTALLCERMKKAIDFFATELTGKIMAPVREHLSSLQYNSRVNRYKVFLHELELITWQSVQKLLNASYGEIVFTDNSAYSEFSPGVQPERKRKKREPKGSSIRMTSELFISGKSIEEIAQIRQMAVGTIQTHVAQMVSTGEIDIADLMPVEKIQNIQLVMEEEGMNNMSAIKNRLGDEYTYFEIRVVYNHTRYLNEQTA